MLLYSKFVLWKENGLFKLTNISFSANSLLLNKSLVIISFSLLDSFSFTSSGWQVCSFIVLVIL